MDNNTSHINEPEDDKRDNGSRNRVVAFVRRHWHNYDIQATFWTALFMLALLALANVGISLIESQERESPVAVDAQQGESESAWNELFISSVSSDGYNDMESDDKIGFPPTPAYLPVTASINLIPDSPDSPAVFNISRTQEPQAPDDANASERQKRIYLSGTASQTTIDAFFHPFGELYDESMTSGDDGNGNSSSDHELEESAIAETSLQETNAILDDIHAEGGDAGFILLDLKTGKGVSYNADEPIYSASTIKAPLAAYILQEYVEPGTLSLDGHLGSLIASSITYSDNDSHIYLYERFHDGLYLEWLASNGITHGVHDGAGAFATLSARDAAKLWLNIYGYISSGAEAAQWFSELLSNTNMSFIRDSADQVLTVEEVLGDELMISVAPTVYNKAGWYNDGVTYASANSTSDNAIIRVGDDVYLLCIMTNLPYTDSNAELVDSLSSSLLSFAAHSPDKINSPDEQGYQSDFVSEFASEDESVIIAVAESDDELGS